MRSAKVIIAVALVLMLLCGTAAGETWRAAEEDYPMFETLLERLETEERDKVKADRKELDDILEMIHLKSAEEYEVGRAIVPTGEKKRPRRWSGAAWISAESMPLWYWDTSCRTER